jgi:zinc protease
VCGDFEGREARELIERYFGGIPRGPDVPAIPGKTEIPDRLPAPMRDTVESSVALARAYLAFRIPAYGRDGFVAADVAANLLASGKSSRLYRSLVREQRLAQSVVAYAFPVVTGAAMLVLWATASPGVELPALEEAVWAELESLATRTSAEEVARAVTGIESRQLVSLQQVGERADQLSMFTTFFDEPQRINTELDAYRELAPDDVRRFASEYLRRDQAAVLSYLPQKKESGAA